MKWNEFSGTDGEWIARTNGFAVDVIEAKSGFGIVHIGTDSELENCDYPKDMAIANAKIIAAAPNLLKALQLALSTPHNEWDGIKQQICFDALEKALGTPIINPRPEGTPDAF